MSVGGLTQSRGAMADCRHKLLLAQCLGDKLGALFIVRKIPHSAMAACQKYGVLIVWVYGIDRASRVEYGLGRDILLTRFVACAAVSGPTLSGSIGGMPPSERPIKLRHLHLKT